MSQLHKVNQKEQMQLLLDKLKELQNSSPSCLDRKYQVLPEDVIKFNTLKLDTDNHINDIESIKGAIKYLQASMDYHRACELIGE